MNYSDFLDRCDVGVLTMLAHLEVPVELIEECLEEHPDDIDDLLLGAFCAVTAARSGVDFDTLWDSQFAGREAILRLRGNEIECVFLDEEGEE